MFIRLKDAVKLIGISIISCCAVFVCTLFLNFNMDIVTIKDQITSEAVMGLYDAQVVMGKVISAISGGCLLLTSVVMLFFYIKHYIDVHKKELGILKALGYSDLRIAKGFWVFGFSIFLGTAIGFGSSFTLMPTFYRVMNEDAILPDIPVHFNSVLVLYLVILPTLLFAFLSVMYSYLKLKRPVLELLRGKTEGMNSKKKIREKKSSEMSFLKELRRSTVKSRTSLVFFIAFASFCYSAMMQMSFSMDELASEMFTAIIVIIGLVLACTTLFLAITTVVNSNIKTIAMMKVFGYSLEDCCRAILNGYRPVAYVGFAIGTFYQYGLIKLTISFYLNSIDYVPDYHFDWNALVIVFLSFVLIYEIIMAAYAGRIKKISVKEIMLES